MVDFDRMIGELARFLPPQGPLYEFVAQNPLSGFLGVEFHESLRRAGQTFGAWSYLPLGFYREQYEHGKISINGLEFALSQKNFLDGDTKSRLRVDLFEYPEGQSQKPKGFLEGGIRAKLSERYRLNLMEASRNALFRLLSGYLDQGVSYWDVPGVQGTFRDFVYSLACESVLPFYPLNHKSLAAIWPLDSNEGMKRMLDELVTGEESFQNYIAELIFGHVGWSAAVLQIQTQVSSLWKSRTISLKDVLFVELMLDYALLRLKLGDEFSSLKQHKMDVRPIPMFQNEPFKPMDLIKSTWHEAWEWSQFHQALSLIRDLASEDKKTLPCMAQMLFCIDDREGSVRRYIEQNEPCIHTFGLPGFFGIDFLHRWNYELHPVRQAPIILKPKDQVVSFIRGQNPRNRTLSLERKSSSYGLGWLVTHWLGLFSGLRLIFSIFHPKKSHATSSAVKHANMDLARWSLAKEGEEASSLMGISLIKLRDAVKTQLQAIGLVENFASTVWVIGHGSTTTNNTHYSAYDCGACSGKSGESNARIFAWAANHPEVRKSLAEVGIVIPVGTTFVAAVHDTTRDEITILDTLNFSSELKEHLAALQNILDRALQENSVERCRRFELVDPKTSAADVWREVKRRSFAIFEPRPELTHTGNMLAVVGRRKLTANGFLDRRAFLHSYDPTLDPGGDFLLGILRAVIPVCGGINLCYFFSAMDTEVYGAGSKLPHNVVSLIGVANGTQDDLQTGLPRQMIEYHDPMRLLLVIEQDHLVIERVLSLASDLKRWVLNGWMKLASIHPQTRVCHIWQDDCFREVPETWFTDPVVCETPHKPFAPTTASSVFSRLKRRKS